MRLHLSQPLPAIALYASPWERVTEVGAVVETKGIVKSCETIICCAQLNRGTESRLGEGKRPTLADLRDSGSIEQDADIVLFLYRDEYYKDISGGAQNDADAADSANIAEVIVAKNRHGSVKNIKMGWVGQFTKFRTLEDDTKYGN